MNKPTPLTSVHFATQSPPRHIAIIMDGNRRWARSHNLPSLTGHRRGLRQLLALLPVFSNSGVEVLTLFGFSSANWQREQCEVDSLMRLADQAVRRFIPICIQHKIRVEIIGRRDRLPKKLVAGIYQAEQDTSQGDRLLRVAIDYSAREAIFIAARNLPAHSNIEDFSHQLNQTCDVDLLIRTGKEQRLSDFLLWECAYAELYFPDLYWPDFTIDTLETAISWYHNRNRRFGT